MRVFKDNEELKKEIKDGVIKINDDIFCNFDINVDADIDAGNIKAGNIKAYNIKAYNIEAYNIDTNNIDARNIDAYNIEAWNIDAGNIEAGNIEANNIKACNIEAYNIKANDISYYGFCISYKSIKCTSISGRRVNGFHKCLDGELIIKESKKVITS